MLEDAARTFRARGDADGERAAPFWTNSNPLFGTDAYAILEFDAHDDYRFVGWHAPIFTGVLGRFIGAIRPGMVRVEASSSDPAIRPVAFVDPASGALSVVAVNNADDDRVVLVESNQRTGVLLPNGMVGDVAGRGVRAFAGAVL